MKKEYIRDGRSPKPLNEHTSVVMSSNKAKNTKPELSFRKELWRNGLIGYRIHKKSIIGKPDISYQKRKVAIFINGCFWHRCTKCNLPLPKSNKIFWRRKFDINVNRDKLKINQLRDIGWRVLVFWECDIRNNLEACIFKTKSFINKK